MLGKIIMRKKLVLTAIVAVIVAVSGGYLLFKKSSPPPQSFVAAKFGNIVQEVSVTGMIKPLKSVDLAFEKSGRVINVGADVGNQVAAGQILLKLDDSELSAQLAKANADLQVNRAELEKSKLDLKNYYDGIDDILNDAYTKANDAVRKQIEDLFTGDETLSPQLSFGTSNQQTQTSVEFQMLRATQELNSWLKEIGTINSSTPEETLESYLANAKKRLSLIRTLLDLASEAVTNSTNLTSATISTYKTNLNTARANINTALASVNTREQDIASQKTTIDSKVATVASYEASIENINAQMQKTILLSPISGTVSRQDTNVGEIVAANTIVISVISVGKLSIEANAPEADISRLKIGDSAKITLDAYGDEIFEASVVSIDPAEKIIDGVATYKTTFLFKHGDTRIKPGMTANIDVLTASKDNVIIVPRRSVLTRDGKKFVLIYGEKVNEEREVQTGLVGSDGNIEITGGLKEGEKVISNSAE